MNRVNELTLMRQMVDDALGILSSETVPITDFGKLLHENWQYKRSLSDKVSTSEIDQIYDVAMKTGALGGKILGAGGGGFMLIFATPDRHKAIREALNKLVHVSFKFDDSGSKVVLYQPDGL
jgi:D-glycero-alpha-D-manno-heptose-7-phosphate kinase